MEVWINWQGFARIRWLSWSCGVADLGCTSSESCAGAWGAALLTLSWLDLGVPHGMMKLHFSCHNDGGKLSIFFRDLKEKSNFTWN